MMDVEAIAEIGNALRGAAAGGSPHGPSGVRQAVEKSIVIDEMKRQYYSRRDWWKQYIPCAVNFADSSSWHTQPNAFYFLPWGL
jgi:hypothetical protein